MLLVGFYFHRPSKFSGWKRWLAQPFGLCFRCGWAHEGTSHSNNYAELGCSLSRSWKTHRRGPEGIKKIPQGSPCRVFNRPFHCWMDLQSWEMANRYDPTEAFDSQGRLPSPWTIHMLIQWLQLANQLRSVQLNCCIWVAGDEDPHALVSSFAYRTAPLIPCL